MSENKPENMETEDGREEQFLPFMDSFYSLSSNDAQERSFAATSIIKHVFFEEIDAESIAAKVKDGTYAMTRLLNGLCSGRASARQGFASCLTTFLETSFNKAPGENGDKMWIVLFMDHTEQSSEISPAEFVRDQLRECTNFEGPVKGKNGGKRNKAEDRDNRFGRLFGILSIIRSGTLVDASLQVLKDYALDLISLYDHKIYFREPAVHALKEIFSFISTSCSMDMFDQMVRGTMSKFFKLTCSWSTEKIALYLHLQTIYMDNSFTELPQCLGNALLTKSNLDCDIGGGVMKIMLRDTSSTVHPKRHLVWNTIWCYVSKLNNDGKDRVLREKLIVGDDTASDIIDGLVNKVIVENLLVGEGADKSSINATPGRRALALSLLQQLCSMNLSPRVLEDIVLQRPIVTNLFIKTIQKFSSGGKHTLKPLALDILQKVTNSLCSGGLTEDSVLRRSGAARAFLKANQAFDSVTKTETVSLLLGLDLDEKTEGNADESGRKSLWELHFQFVMNEILNRLKSDEPELHEAIKFMDVMFAFVKKILRIGNDDEKKSLVGRTLSFFMVGGFFDVQRFSSSKDGHLFNAAKLVKNCGRCIPYGSRVIMCSRFFSILSDYMHTMTFQQIGEGQEIIKDKKSQVVLKEVSRINADIQLLQESGASLFSNTHIDGDEKIDNDEICFSLGSMEFINNIIDLDVKQGEHAKTIKKAIDAIACLVSSLSLQLLHPGHPQSDDDEDPHDEDEDHAEIMEIMSELSTIASSLAESKPSVTSEGAKDEFNFLGSLAEIGINILRSPIGGGGVQASNIRGGASKIVRECLQIAWTTSLAASATIPGDILNTDVMSLLLEAVCTPKALAQGENAPDDEDMEEYDEGDEDTDEDGDEMTFSFSNATEIKINADSDHSMDDNEEECDKSDDEIELDSSKLENLLIHSSDDDDSVDDNILEHHEGADAALARLIKLKQESRKLGKDQKEKVELEDKVRCLSLLEAVFYSNKRTTLLSNQVTLMVILPLLRTQTELLKSLSSAMVPKKGTSLNNKKVLMEKITNLLSNKVSKTNVDGKANLEACRTVAQQVLVESRRVKDDRHSKCCGSLLLLLVKAVMEHGDNAIEMARSIYEDAITEWSLKKSTNIQSIIFVDLEQRSHSIAVLVLTNALVNASREARSSYLKCECFRIISSLYLIQQSQTEGVAVLSKAAPSLSTSLSLALQDDEMRKTKRVRDVLKAVERFSKFANEYGDNEIWSGLKEVQVEIMALMNFSDSSAVQNICKKLNEDIDQGMLLYTNKIAEEQKANEEAQEDEPATSSNLKSPKSKKSKKKSGSKKKKKRK